LGDEDGLEAAFEQEAGDAARPAEMRGAEDLFVGEDLRVALGERVADPGLKDRVREVRERDRRLFAGEAELIVADVRVSGVGHHRSGAGGGRLEAAEHDDPADGRIGREDGRGRGFGRG
jgi:hypothetical protein